MSLQRQFKRHGKDFADAVIANREGPTITRQKPVRPSNSYRGARRNMYFEMAKEHFKATGTKPVDFRTFCHTLWSKAEWSIAPLMNMTRASRTIGAPHPRSHQARIMKLDPIMAAKMGMM